MQDTADLGIVGVHCRMHSDHGALDGWQIDLPQGPPSSPARTTMEAG
jgi:hypothetical protein